jgi:hypothetical protein
MEVDMKIGLTLATGVAFLALAACGNDGTVDPDVTPPTAIKSLYALQDCTPDDADIVGTINIIIPKQIDGKKISRLVYVGPKVLPGDPQTGENSNGWKANAKDEPQPFDLFMRNTIGEFGETGFFRVRVLIRHNADWEFYQKQDEFYGVLTENPSDSVVCGVNPIIVDQNGSSNQAGQIASFYVDLDKLYAQPEGYSVPFTIGLIAIDKPSGPPNPNPTAAPVPPETPILIDPKVRNDGGLPLINPGPQNFVDPVLPPTGNVVDE